MHEGTVAQGVLDTALGALPPGQRITRVVVVCGTLVGIVAESLQLFFGELARGTAAEGAAIQIVVKPAVVSCRQCGAQTEHESGTPLDIQCKSCGGSLRLSGGRELYLEAMEVEETTSSR